MERVRIDGNDLAVLAVTPEGWIVSGLPTSVLERLAAQGKPANGMLVPVPHSYDQIEEVVVDDEHLKGQMLNNYRRACDSITEAARTLTAEIIDLRVGRTTGRRPGGPKGMLAVQARFASKTTADDVAGLLDKERAHVDGKTVMFDISVKKDDGKTAGENL